MVCLLPFLFMQTLHTHKSHQNSLPGVCVGGGGGEGGIQSINEHSLPLQICQYTISILVMQV